MEIELPPDFREYLKLLNAYRVESLLTGGFDVFSDKRLRLMIGPSASPSSVDSIQLSIH
jgi:hypothetical protein